MDRKVKTGAWLLALAAAVPVGVQAQGKVEASVGADLVSGYIWRGQDLGNVSIQPSASISYRGFSLSGWGSVGFEKEDTKEFDLTFGYAHKGFSVSVTDYWFNSGPGYFHYGSTNTSHVFEVQVGYDFGLLALNWYTNFAGNDGVNKDGDRAYSSYLSVVAPFKLGGLDWTAGIGATPWANTFYNGGASGFEVCDIRCIERNRHYRFVLVAAVCQIHLEPGYGRRLFCRWYQFLTLIRDRNKRANT